MPAEAFFMESAPGPLFCRLDCPAGGLIRDAGVLICHAIGPDYFRSYRALSRLAEQLAEHGFPVMRFDYPGTGDSAGELQRLRLSDWTGAVRQAAEELQNRTGTRGLILLGLRFGATLALLATRQLARVDTLVLWDPVTNGRAYLEHARQLHAGMLQDTDRFRRGRRSGVTPVTEILGARYSDGLLAEMAEIDAEPALTATAGQTLVLNSQHSTPLALDDGGGLQSESDYGWETLERLEECIMDPAAIRQLDQQLRALHP